MKKNLVFIAFSLFVCVVLGSCVSSTTAAGAVNADRKQLMIFSEEEMNEGANESYAQIIEESKKSGTLNTDKNTYNRVNTIAKRLIEQVPSFRTDALNWDWQVNVIKEDTVNAWCMPGGKIVVYTGIIETLSLTDAQLAAVMGHEIAHALREHSREQASKEALKNLGIQAIGKFANLSDTSLSIVAMASQYAVTLPFSRANETEADHIGTELMARAGYDPYEAVNVWKKMSQLSGDAVPALMSTHPSHENRIKDLTVIAEKVYPLYKK